MMPRSPELLDRRPLQLPRWSRSAPLLQRKCACGGNAGPDGECEACREKRLQRKASVTETGLRSNAAPPIVNVVLSEAGQPLNAATRAAVEPRFNHDFSHVRIHTDERAAESARAVNAQAYTVGQNVVFASGHYSPQTPAGRWLLNHELAHVVQQSHSTSSAGPLEITDISDHTEHAADRAADAISAGEHPPMSAGSTRPMVARKVVAGNVRCTTGKHGAPTDPVAALTTAESRAQGLSNAAAILAQVGSAATAMGIDVTTRGIGPSYVARFGRPPAAKGGFLNRLSGRVVPRRNDAISGELELLGSRLQRISDNFDRPINYPCIGGQTTFMGCEAHCTGRDAAACAGIRAIFLCPGFWGLSENGQATLLIHEAAHMIWANVVHVANFRHASCYANFVADVFSAPTTTPDCPAPR